MSEVESYLVDKTAFKQGVEGVLGVAENPYDADREVAEYADWEKGFQAAKLLEQLENPIRDINEKERDLLVMDIMKYVPPAMFVDYPVFTEICVDYFRRLRERLKEEGTKPKRKAKSKKKAEAAPLKKISEE